MPYPPRAYPLGCGHSSAEAVLDPRNPADLTKASRACRLWGALPVNHVQEVLRNAFLEEKDPGADRQECLLTQTRLSEDIPRMHVSGGRIPVRSVDGPSRVNPSGNAPSQDLRFAASWFSLRYLSIGMSAWVYTTEIWTTSKPFPTNSCVIGLPGKTRCLAFTGRHRGKWTDERDERYWSYGSARRWPLASSSRFICSGFNRNASMCGSPIILPHSFSS